VRRGKFWAKDMGYSEVLWEHNGGTHGEHGKHHREPIENLGNIIRNKWEQNENIMGTKELKNTILANQRKKRNPLGCMFSHLIGCIHILFLDMVTTFFCLSKKHTKPLGCLNWEQCARYVLNPKLRVTTQKP
jgi:hypothetical protein